MYYKDLVAVRGNPIKPHHEVRSSLQNSHNTPRILVRSALVYFNILHIFQGLKDYLYLYLFSSDNKIMTIPHRMPRLQ